MKYVMTLGVILVTLSLSGQAGCSEYYPFAQGTLTEWTTFDKKDKPSSVITYEVVDASDQKATIKNSVADKDGELISESEFDITCSGNGVEIDIQSMYSPQLMAQYENMETNITGSKVSLPNGMKEGDELKDAEMNVSIDMGGINMNIDVMMTDRVVVGEETVKTAAGSFDCVVIEYNTKIKMGLERNGMAKQWIAKGVGMVKQEDYNKRGKVMSRTELTTFKK